MPPQLRPALPTDLAALTEVAYATGFFGRSAEVYFPAKRLFGELWVGPYLGPAGGCGLVLEEGGQILGYVLGAQDPLAYRRYFLQGLPRWLLQAAQGRFSGLEASLRFLLRALRYPSKAAPNRLFPAHLHLNLLSGVRGQGWGERLLRAHLACLQQKGLPGVQLSTTEENRAALGLYQKLGFREYARWTSPLWAPWLGRPVVHLTLVLPLGGD
ncbi:GNAT family N-acetyltransferase [Calidithermus timidus]|jgi:ribosomal protein S18 acetylase RimI-like enzyme|uniref:GNAT family N-acetyltransferase n=1 Tax=Calidithermus timidus TaxID=307124 RepID=UPI000371C34F|nr:GNAT family N-acetyltransferase [Calidithermus timidus]